MAKIVEILQKTHEKPIPQSIGEALSQKMNMLTFTLVSLLVVQEEWKGDAAWSLRLIKQGENFGYLC